MGVKLYYLPFSPPCRSVMFLAKELGVDLELKPVDLFQGEHLQPWYVEVRRQRTYTSSLNI
jgi:glutathione S-transferase